MTDERWRVRPDAVFYYREWDRVGLERLTAGAPAKEGEHFP